MNTFVKDKIYPPDMTLAEVQAEMEKEDIQQALAWGDVHDDARWGAGALAMKYVHRGLPVKQVLIVIGILSDYSPASVKKFLACARFYDTHDDLARFKPYTRYSIMAHAARHETPIKVLKYAEKTAASPLEIQRLFPVDEVQEEAGDAPSVFGVEYKAFKRWGYNIFRDNENKTREFEQMWNEFITRLQALIETK